MRNDFCAMILSHGRPGRVSTLGALEKGGYTGKVYIVIDDEDDTADEYRERYGDMVLQFNKREAAEWTDAGNNFEDRRSVLYARNVSFELAKQVGCRFFLQLDDDYKGFYYRYDEQGYFGAWRIHNLDWMFSGLVDYLAATPFASVTISQTGDYIGGGARNIGSRRKAMNTFFCDTEKPFQFVGEMNDDVNTYVSLQRRGIPFLMFLQPTHNQGQTQANTGGLTDIYLDNGTYVKSFYSVMICPSAVTIGSLRDAGTKGGMKRDGTPRIHHSIDWNAVAPKIIRQEHKK